VVGATLGEVRNRADVVVFWGVDPVTTHRRHLERYSVEPRGRFVPEGRAGRAILVADASRTPTACLADVYLPIVADRQLEILSVLRAMVRGIDLDDEAVQAATGLEPATLRGFADRLLAARYGAFFHGPGLGDSPTIEAALLLVRDLNATTRFVALTLGEPGNPSGDEAVLAWQTGFSHAVDLAPGFPRYRPGEATAEARLAAGEADLAVLVGSPGDLSPAASEYLRRIPRIWLATDATEPARTPAPTVGLAAAEPGIECGGTVLRCDGVTLPLRPSLASPWPTAVQWLGALLARMSHAS
jgi:formylmethanofuran dehydrogenase subunit B